jgi:acyl-coenzyme A thioesterase PaaI-like protein
MIISPIPALMARLMGRLGNSSEIVYIVRRAIVTRTGRSFRPRMERHMESPAGFEPFYRKSPLTDPWEPVYCRRAADKVVLGIHAREAHCNARSIIHGGLIAALADNAMGHSCVAAMTTAGRQPQGLLTVSLSVDYIGTAKPGQWLAFDTVYTKTGRTLCFAQCFVTADGEIIARADAKFRVM